MKRIWREYGGCHCLKLKFCIYFWGDTALNRFVLWNGIRSLLRETASTKNQPCSISCTAPGYFPDWLSSSAVKVNSSHCYTEKSHCSPFSALSVIHRTGIPILPQCITFYKWRRSIGMIGFTLPSHRIWWAQNMTSGEGRRGGWVVQLLSLAAAAAFTELEDNQDSIWQLWSEHCRDDF